MKVIYKEVTILKILPKVETELFLGLALKFFFLKIFSTHPGPMTLFCS